MGSEALEIAAKEPTIDLLLTDVVMPGGMTGTELAVAFQKTRHRVCTTTSTKGGSNTYHRRS